MGGGKPAESHLSFMQGPPLLELSLCLKFCLEQGADDPPKSSPCLPAKAVPIAGGFASQSLQMYRLSLGWQVVFKRS